MMKKRNVAVAMAAVSVASTVAPAFATGTEIAKENQFVVSTGNTKELVKAVKALLEEKYAAGDKKAGENVYTIFAEYNNQGQKTKKINKFEDLQDLISNDDVTNIKLEITENGHVKDSLGNHSEAKEKYDSDSLAKLFSDLGSKKEQGILDVDIENLNNEKAEVSVKFGTEFSETNKVFDSASVELKINKENKKINTDEIKVNVNGKYKSIQDIKGEIDKIIKGLEYSQVNEHNNISQNDCYKLLLKLSEVTEEAFISKLTITPKQKEEVSKLLEDNTMTTRDNGELRKLIKESLELFNENGVVGNPTDQQTGMEGDVLNLSKKMGKIKTLFDNEKNKNILDYLYIMNELQDVTEFKEAEEKSIYDDNKKIFQVSLADTEEETVEAETLFDGTMLTDEGKELINVLEKGIEIDGELFKVKADGEYKINTTSKDNYELVMNFIGTNKVATPRANSLDKKEFRFQVKVTSDDKEELQKISEMFTIGADGKVEGYAIDSIIGARRTETAVKISKENFEPTKKDGNVVLVGANAVVDGLAAGPLAKKLNAPVLLTNADSLDAKVEEEISRLLVDDTKVADLKTQTVYIVGGESVVSENVVEQLENLGVVVERLAGDRRDTTALAVAEKMDDLGAKFDKAFVVGAKGEADAMSIAAHAAKIEAPIIVNGLDGTLSKEAKKLIKDKQIDIIGGETVVSKELAEELKDIDKNGRVVRVEGSNRAETNANVIEKYYGGAKHVYIAKDGKIEGNDKLVDALAISPVAAEDGVVVLATNELTKEQKDALDLKASNAKKVTQVGGGVSETVVTKVAKLLGLVK